MSDPSAYILLGFPRAGKSVLGSQLAASLGYVFHDLDQWIEKAFRKKEGITRNCRQIWGQQGKTYFRSLESATLADFHKTIRGQKGWVLSVGGGTPLLPENQALIRSLKVSGVRVIYLQVPSDTLWQRMKETGFPLSLDQENLEESFAAHYTERHDCYTALADYTIQVGAEQEAETLQKIQETLEGRS